MKRLLTLGAGLLLISCSSAPDEAQPRGTEGGECRDEGGCDGDLVCASGICVAPPDDTKDAGRTDIEDARLPDVATAPEDVAPSVDATADPDAAPDVGGDEDMTPDEGAGSGEPPTVMITDPADGASFAYFEEIELHAIVDDPEDGPLDGDAVTWSSDLAGVLGTGNRILRPVELGGDHVVTCTAVDSDGNEASATVTIEIRSPIARIFHPGDGETRTVGSDIPFVGRGDDAEDGELTGMSLVWTSDIDGQFGTGRDFSAPLSEGMNTVTLTVTDADGNSAETSITLDMVP